jgi:hypothetical protein
MTSLQASLVRDDQYILDPEIDDKTDTNQSRPSQSVDID